MFPKNRPTGTGRAGLRKDTGRWTEHLGLLVGHKSPPTPGFLGEEVWELGVAVQGLSSVTMWPIAVPCPMGGLGPGLRSDSTPKDRPPAIHCGPLSLAGVGQCPWAGERGPLTPQMPSCEGTLSQPLLSAGQGHRSPRATLSGCPPPPRGCSARKRRKADGTRWLPSSPLAGEKAADGRAPLCLKKEALQPSRSPRSRQGRSRMRAVSPPPPPTPPGNLGSGRAGSAPRTSGLGGDQRLPGASAWAP